MNIIIIYIAIYQMQKYVDGSLHWLNGLCELQSDI